MNSNQKTRFAGEKAKPHDFLSFCMEFSTPWSCSTLSTHWTVPPRCQGNWSSVKQLFIINNWKFAREIVNPKKIWKYWTGLINYISFGVVVCINCITSIIFNKVGVHLCIHFTLKTWKVFIFYLFSGRQAWFFSVIITKKISSTHYIHCWWFLKCDNSR